MTYKAKTSSLYILRSLTILLCICPLPAWAVTITTFAEYSVDGVTVTDSDSAAVGAILSEVTSTFDFTDNYAISGLGPGTASAAQNIAGFGAVLADSAFYSGSSFTNSMTATATWSDTATNTSSAAQDYDFTFLITPAQLALGDFAGASVGMAGAPEANYSVSILLDGVSIFGSSAILEGGSVSHLLTETGTDLGGTFFGGSSVFGYDFDAYIDTLSLGSLNPGESLTVDYIMTVGISAAAFELGGRAAIGDPFDLSGSGAGGTIVPVPAAAWLFGSGLLGIVGVARRKKMA